jgi:hypothetical protein
MLDKRDDRLFRVEVQRVPESASPFCRSGRSTAGELGEVSISWWMSQPMQSYLDQQLCRDANANAIEQTMRISASAEPYGGEKDQPACKTATWVPPQPEPRQRP